jgi:drug/metabolite transporter (DMT)-like permease
VASASDNLRGAAFMMIAVAGFTGSDACMKAITAEMPLFQALTLRGLLSVPALLLIGHLSGGLRLAQTFGPRARPFLALRTLGEVGSTVTFFAALLHLPFATVSAILQSAPLAVTLAAALFLRERVGWRRLTAIVAGLAGVLVILRPGSDAFTIWSVVALLTVCAIVLRDLASRRMPPEVPSVSVAIVSAMAVTVLSAILSTRSDWVAVTPRTGALIVGAACFVMIGYIFIVRVMRLGDVSFTTAFRYTALVWATLIGWAVFAEVPDAATFAGGAIVVGSGLFMLARERRLRAAPPAPPTPPAA